MMIPQLRVDRLVELMTSNPARSACECLNLWKAEYERELLEYDTLAKQMNADSQYTVVRIEPVKWNV